MRNIVVGREAGRLTFRLEFINRVKTMTIPGSGPEVREIDG